jgi:hypothetical protein
MPDGDGTGKVKFTVKADDAILINLFLATVLLKMHLAVYLKNDLQKNRC